MNRKQIKKSKGSKKVKQCKSTIDMLEICTGSRSSLAACWAKHCKRAVRIEYRKKRCKTKRGPEPTRQKSKLAQTWELNLKVKKDKKALVRYIKKHKPRHIWGQAYST